MAALSWPGNRCIRVARQSGSQGKMLESLLKINTDEMRVDFVVRRAPPLEIRRSTRRGDSMLKSCLKACRALLCAVDLLLQVNRVCQCYS